MPSTYVYNWYMKIFKLPRFHITSDLGKYFLYLKHLNFTYIRFILLLMRISQFLHKEEENDNDNEKK